MMIFWTSNAVLFLMVLLLVAADKSSSCNLVKAFAFGYVNYRGSDVSSTKTISANYSSSSNNNNINWYASSYRDTTGTTTTTTAAAHSSSSPSELKRRKRRRKNKTGRRIGGRQHRHRNLQRKPQRTTKQNTNPFLSWLPDEEVYATTITSQIPYNFFNKELVVRGKTTLGSSIVRDQRNQPWTITVEFNCDHGSISRPSCYYPSHPAADLIREVPGLVDKNNKDMTDPINTNSAVSICLIYNEDEVYRGENNINSKIILPIRKLQGSNRRQKEIYRGEKNKESRIVVTKGSIRFRNHSAEFQDGCFTQHGYGSHLATAGRGGVLAEWPWNQIVSACDHEGKLTVVVDIEYKLVPRSIPKIVLERLQNYKVRYVEYDEDEDNK
ncbi:hypothetical protein FRACYDRAFT_248100 [Fragilariopsis cylindrus CCMP1102]|uniref:Uncharacterized protein n=1 Tax=Fragilariopsis cylindrus CCMP1102 TaxID=635003 RepID=A0A1E7EUZ7_9STRA|nr:hypothetical protein FRACYDRAFT_248100 [Fragilariopsis cylindrus CCMP1102]|eukprot:OEU09850.1 hypothetical protein FRACYDRAFT_248100 [Fragilariopsis cylindrus CCMP1102]